MLKRRLTMADTVFWLLTPGRRRRRPSYPIDPMSGKLIRPDRPRLPLPEAATFAHAYYADRQAATPASAAS